MSNEDQKTENMTENDLAAQAEDVAQGAADARVYEVGYLLIPTISIDEAPKAYGDIKELVASLGGDVISDEMPRMINLAYTMQKVTANVRSKYDTAYFGWIKFYMNADKVLELKKKLDLEPKVIRFIVLKTVKENTIAAKRFVHREMGGTMPHKPGMGVGKREEKEGEAPVEINKEEIDREIDALVSTE